MLSYLIPFTNLLDERRTGEKEEDEEEEEEEDTFTGQRENTSTATVWTQPCNTRTNFDKHVIMVYNVKPSEIS